jgi:hypothetical protein
VARPKVIFGFLFQEGLFQHYQPPLYFVVFP